MKSFSLNIKKVIVIIFAIFFSTNLLFSQETDVPTAIEDEPVIESESIDIIKPYEPVLADAVRIKFSPSLPTKAELDRAKPKFDDYFVPNRFLTMNYEPAALKPLSYRKSKKKSSTEKEELYNVWIRAGAGNLALPLLEAAVSTSQSDKFVAGLHAAYIAGKSSKLEFQDYGKMSVGAFGKSFLETAYAQFKLDYQRDTYHYYGFHADTLLFDVPEIADSIRQNFQTISAAVELGSSTENDMEIDYKLDAALHLFSDNYDAKEQNIILNGEATKVLTEVSLLEGHFRTYFSNFKRDTTGNSNLALDISPKFTMLPSIGKITLGASLLLNSGKFYPFPYIAAELNLSPEKLQVYASWKKEIVSNNYMNLSEKNPFLGLNFELKNSVYEQRSIGLKGLVASNINYNINVYQNISKDQPLFVNDSTDMTKFGIIYDTKMTNLGGKIELNYLLKDKGSIGIDANVNAYNTEQEEEAWHLPSMKVGINGRYQFSPKLSLGIDVFVLSGAKARLADGTTTNLKGTADINLAVKYEIIKNVALFCNVNNLAGIKYERYLNYPTYGFNALGGLIVRF
ncbi:MAG: hypothetical protein ACPG5B_06935 [Chitinophagales bacterium]